MMIQQQYFFFSVSAAEPEWEEVIIGDGKQQ